MMRNRVRVRRPNGRARPAPGPPITIESIVRDPSQPHRCPICGKEHK